MDQRLRLDVRGPQPRFKLDRWIAIGAKYQIAFREMQDPRHRFKGVVRTSRELEGTAVRTKSLTSEQMEARVARFNKLQTHQRQNFEAHNIPPGGSFRPSRRGHSRALVRL
jgi:hypothetical protein